MTHNHACTCMEKRPNKNLYIEEQVLKYLNGNSGSAQCKCLLIMPAHAWIRGNKKNKNYTFKCEAGNRYGIRRHFSSPYLCANVENARKKSTDAATSCCSTDRLLSTADTRTREREMSVSCVLTTVVSQSAEHAHVHWGVPSSHRGVAWGYRACLP